MDSLERFKKVIFKWEHKALVVIGCEFMLDGTFMGINFRLLNVIALAITFLIPLVYTLIYSDFVTKLHCTFFMCLLSQVFMKAENALHYKECSWFFHFVQDLYVVNSKSESLRRQNVLKIFSLITEYLFYLEYVIYLMSALAMYIPPLLTYVIDHEITLVLPLRLPWVSESTTEGICVYWIYHTCCVLGCALGMAIVDFFYAIPIIHTFMMAELMRDEIDQLNEHLIQPKEDKLITKTKFQNILLMHQQMAGYMSKFEIRFFKICFVQIVSAALASVILLFLTIAYNYLPAYILVLNGFGQMFLFCALGTVVEIANQRIYDQSMELKWYLLPKKDQQLYGFYLTNCQNAKLLSVGGIAPLNLDTLVTIYKTIYNATMIGFSMLL